MRAEPTGVSWIDTGIAPRVPFAIGGVVQPHRAGQTLVVGADVELDLDTMEVSTVGTTPGAIAIGTVVGGKATRYTCCDQVTDAGQLAALEGQLVLVCVLGVAYRGTDPGSAIKTPIFPGSSVFNVISALHEYQVLPTDVGVTNPGYRRGDPRRHGALGAGHDDTNAVLNAVQSLANLSGGVLYLDLIYTVAQSIVLPDNVTILGGGAGIGGLRAKAGVDFGLGGGIIKATGKKKVYVWNVDIDGNNSAGAKSYGLWAKDGNRLEYIDVYVHDTFYAGVLDQDQLDTTMRGVIAKDCGKTALDNTDDHGIMIGSVGGQGQLRTKLIGCQVQGTINPGDPTDFTTRKGITTYAFSGGVCSDYQFEGCLVTGCGLGGFYLAQTGATMTRGTLIGCISSGNYSNYFMSGLTILTMSGCHGLNAGDDCNINCQDSSDVTVSGGTYDKCGAQGVYFLRCTRCTVSSGTSISRPNQRNFGYVGVELSSSTRCEVSNVIITDSDHHMVACIAESGTSDYNTILDNRCYDSVGAPIQLIGSNTVLRALGAGALGMGIGSPTTGIDVAMQFGFRETSLVLSNGNNNDVVLPGNGVVYVISGPTAAFTITGIAAPADLNFGRLVILLNMTVADAPMTIAHLSGLSSAHNKFVNATEADIALEGTWSAVILKYSAGAPNAWVVVSTF